MNETVQVSAEGLFAFAHDAFAQVDKLATVSGLVGFFIDALYHDLLLKKIVRKIQNILDSCSICSSRTKFNKRLQLANT